MQTLPTCPTEQTQSIKPLLYIVPMQNSVRPKRESNLAGVLSGGIQKEIQDMMTMRTEGT